VKVGGPSGDAWDGCQEVNQEANQEANGHRHRW
jgi:hypothetical protein